MNFLKSIFLTLTILWQKHETLSKLEVEFDQLEDLTEQVGTLLSNCTRLHVNNIAVLSDSRAIIKWTPKSLQRISLLNLKIANLTEPFRWNIRWQEKFHTFIIITSGAENLKYLIEGMKHSTLWNRAGLYVLFDSRTVENGCQNAGSFLKLAWQYDLLSSTFFCVDPLQGFMLYTFNPFIPWAPKSWREVSNDKMNDRNHTWTLFKKNLIPGLTTCKDITFHKSSKLYGYPLKVLGLHFPPALTLNMSKHGFDILGGFEEKIFRSIWTKWNATLNVTLYKKGMANYLYLKNITSGQYDLLLNLQYIFNKPDMTMTYTHISTGLTVLTRFPDYEDKYIIILKYMNPTFIAGILLISLATGIVLGKCTGQGITRGCLEVIRILTGVSMINIPKIYPLRIYLSTMLLLVILTTSTFQGNLSSLLTSPILKPSINTMDDLKESGYTIYMFHGYKSLMYDNVLDPSIQTLDTWNCSALVENDEDVACVADAAALTTLGNKQNFYFSKHRICTIFAAYVVRPNWPLVDQLSQMLMILNEGGLINFVWNQPLSLFNRKLRKLEEEATSKEYHILKLQDVSFAFYILVFGHVVAIVVFIGELCVCKLRKRKTTRGNVGGEVILPFVH